MPALATIADLSARTPGGMASDDAQGLAALADAQGLVIEEAGRGALSDEALDAWYVALTTSQQAMLRMVVCASARRACANPEGLTSEGLGPYSQGIANPSPDVYLTKNELRQVRRLRPTGGLSTLRHTRGPLEAHATTDDGYWPTVNSVDGSAGEPIAFVEPDRGLLD